MTGVRLLGEIVERQADLRPIRMFGGSPISVAVPPMFEAKICENRNGIGIDLERFGDAAR